VTAEGILLLPDDFRIGVFDQVTIGLSISLPPVVSDSRVMRLVIRQCGDVPDKRRRHLYVVGQTSTGKSTLLLNLIAQASNMRVPRV
jgi:hypothetical protein